MSGVRCKLIKRNNLVRRCVVSLLCLGVMSSVVLSADNLSITQTELLALQFDPLLKAQDQQLQAYANEAIAVQAWSDPQLRIGIMDIPSDSFDINAEPMTNVLLGYQQMLPRGDTSHVLQRKKQAEQAQQQAVIELRRREIKLNARNAWLDLYAQQQILKILNSSSQLYARQLDVTETLYANGRGNQQNVLQADLELSLVDDKLEKTRSQITESVARLVQLIGAPAEQATLDDTTALFTEIADDNIREKMLQQHPEVLMQSANVNMEAENVVLAQQQFKPQWGYDLSYERSDGSTIGSQASSTVSVMVLLEVPIMTGNLQEKNLAASQLRLQAQRYASQDMLLRLTYQLQQNQARWQQLTRRLQRYDQQVLNQAQQNAQAALKGYQSGVVSYEAMTRARNAELDTQMQRLDLYVDKARVYAQIQYLTQ